MQKSNGRDANRNQLVLFNLERDCSNIETKPFNLVRFLRFYGLRFLVGFICVLILAGIIYLVLALSIFIDILNKNVQKIFKKVNLRLQLQKLCGTIILVREAR